MRKWACFTEPFPCNGQLMRKIMLYETLRGETFVFLYTGKDSQISCADECYPCTEDALAAWDTVAHDPWIMINDPLPGCQEDAAEPVRIKGRDAGRPEWGRYEILRDGVWHDYTE